MICWHTGAKKTFIMLKRWCLGADLVLIGQKRCWLVYLWVEAPVHSRERWWGGSRVLILGQGSWAWASAYSGRGTYRWQARRYWGADSPRSGWPGAGSVVAAAGSDPWAWASTRPSHCWCRGSAADRRAAESRLAACRSSGQGVLAAVGARGERRTAHPRTSPQAPSVGSSVRGLSGTGKL